MVGVSDVFWCKVLRFLRPGLGHSTTASFGSRVPNFRLADLDHGRLQP